MSFIGISIDRKGIPANRRRAGSIVLKGSVLGFLGLNLWYRVATIFDYSRVVSGVFVCLAVCSLVVIVFPRLLKGFLFLFGASFFLFGFRAYDIQSQVFEAVVVFVALAVAGSRERGAGGEGERGREGWKDGGTEGRRDGGTEGRRDGGSGLNRHLMGLAGCYVGLSVLSLMLLPLGHILKDFWFFGWKSFFLQVANATPNSWLYPLAGMNRLLLFLVFAVEVARTKEAREVFRWIFIGIFVGGVFCAFLGLLDYYGVISLRWYRLGMTVSPGALHSTFLNRSWLAEFILMMAPFVLIGFMSKIKGLWWKLLLLASLVLCEIALLLGGARSGWVSYPLILFVCWLFFYFTKEGRLKSFHFRWRDLVKVAISVPITIVISLLLIFYVIMPLSNIRKDGQETKGTKAPPKHTTEYIERQAGRIVEPSGRLKAWAQGLDVGREKAWFGMGYEAFCWHANILSGIQDSIYTINKANKHKRVLDTPHNIYFQLFVSGGVVGLCFWALVIGYTLLVLVVDLIRNKRLLNVPVIIVIISFHTYGLFQSMQYIPMIWMFIFFALGYTMTIDERVLPEKVRRATRWVIKAMVVVVLIGGVVYFLGRGSQDLADKYGLKVYAADQDWHNYLGFYHKEKWGKKVYRWSGKTGMIRIHSREQGAGSKEQGTPSVVGFDVQCHTPAVEKEPVVVTVSVDGRVVDEMVFDRKGSKERWYYVNGQRSEVGGQRSGVRGWGRHEVLFEVSRTWNPREMGISSDPRDLGVAVSEPVVKEMPKEGVGFYHWEELDEGSAAWIEKQMSDVRGQRSDEVRSKDGETEGLRDGGTKGRRDGEQGALRFRWTGRRASLPILVTKGRRDLETEGDGLVVFLKCSHPDIEERPVVVKVFGDPGAMRSAPVPSAKTTADKSPGATGRARHRDEFHGVNLLRYLEVGDHDWRKVAFKGEELKGVGVLTVEVSRTWNPKRMGVSADRRDLGVAVAIP